MKRTLCFLLLWAATILPGAASGLIIVHESDFWRHPPPPHILPPYPTPPRPIPPPRSAWAPLEVAFNQVHVRIKDQIAVTSVEQEFYNPNPRQLEGTFLFPVPKGGHINKFTMEINGKPVEAELMAADKARGIYEEIVRKLQDPALLEYAGRDLFKVRIFPIEPHARKRVTLSYTQLLKSDGGLVNYIFPLNTEKFSAQPLRTVSLKVDLETKRPLKSIYSPSHKVEIARHGATRATVGYEASNVKPDADFQIIFSQEEDELGLNLLSYKTTGEDGYFLLLASPGVDTKNTKVIPKDVVFVLDTSGSMAGAKLEQAKKALAFCIENLNDHDRFEILRFSTEVEPLFNKLAEASREGRSQAQNFVKDLKPIGGTAIDDALRRALALRPEKGDRPYVVIFLTDGRPTVGTTAEDKIVASVTQASQGNVRVFCFGLGTDVNTHLLDKITEETRAFSQYVLPEEDIEVKVSSFFTKIKEPVLASPRIVFPDSVRVTQLYPAPVPDLFKGEQIVLTGRYSGRGDGAIQIEGSVAGEKRSFAFDVKFPAEAGDHEFIPRLWATRRVGYLLDEIRLRGENKELKDEVTELARKYSIVTPYTAYLIHEDEARRGIAQNAQTFRYLAEDDVQRSRAAKTYSDFKEQKGGDLGVAGARSFYSLKAANAPADAIVAGNVEALRTEALAVPAYGGGAGIATPGTAVSTPLPKQAAITVQARQFAEQSRFVNGRSFYQNGNQWIDSEVQKLTKAKRVRLQFGSPEYFALLKKQPQTLPWLSLGQNVQFVLDSTIYEVHE